MIAEPVFPTALHKTAASVVKDYFLTMDIVDTVLVVNSCARGVATPDSDLDFAVLVSQGTSPAEMEPILAGWETYSEGTPAIVSYKQSAKFAHLHLDIIDGNYKPAMVEIGVEPCCFEIEIGNQICYSAPLGAAGSYFQMLRSKWLPYYDEALRLERLTVARNACEYDLDHIPQFINRGLYFQAFDTLCRAFREYLQTLFIANKTYPIAYNKWIKEQVVNWLKKPDLYPRLPSILSVSNIESNEINEKSVMLRQLLYEVTG